MENKAQSLLQGTHHLVEKHPRPVGSVQAVGVMYQGLWGLCLQEPKEQHLS